MNIKTEIYSQPNVLENLFNKQWKIIKEIATTIRQRQVENIFLVARGTSDNACLYAKYLFGAYNRFHVSLATPSLFSIYKQPPKLTKSLVIGISQSGQSPDIISVITERRAQG